MRKSPSWITGNTAGRGGWCMNAAIMMAASAWHWMMGMDVAVYRAFPVLCCAGGSGQRCCRWIRNWKPSCFTGQIGNAVRCAALISFPVPTGPNTARTVLSGCGEKRRLNASGKDTIILRI